MGLDMYAIKVKKGTEPPKQEYYKADTIGEWRKHNRLHAEIRRQYLSALPEAERKAEAQYHAFNAKWVKIPYPMRLVEAIVEQRLACRYDDTPDSPTENQWVLSESIKGDFWGADSYGKLSVGDSQYSEWHNFLGEIDDKPANYYHDLKFVAEVIRAVETGHDIYYYPSW